MTAAEGTTFTDHEIAHCPGCHSTLGPFLCAAGFNTDGRSQVICTTCGMRGPYEVPHRSAEERWNALPRRPDDVS